MAAIGTIRDKFGWLLIGLMIVSLIAFILMGSNSSGSGKGQVKEDVALVDGEALTNVAFSERVTTNTNNYRQQAQNATLTDEDINAIRNTTYNQMITESLFKKIYANTGIAVGNAEFLDMTTGSRVHQGIANSFKNEAGAFDLEAFNNFVRSLDLDNPGEEPGSKRKSWNAFEEAIINERLTKKYNTLVEKSLTVPTFMAKDQYASDKAQTTFDYVKVPYSTIVDSTLNLKDSDLKAFMAKNAKKYEREASVDLKIVSFNIKASANDKLEAEKWMKTKMDKWKEEKNDSAFITLYSDVPYDEAYYGKDELVSNFKDSIFSAPVGTILGYQDFGTSFSAAKLADRKMIPDSLRARHLLISLDKVKTQEEAMLAFAKYDSLFTLVDSLGFNLADLTAANSDDQSNAAKGGDLEWVKPGQMVKPFNDLIFFGMKEGEVKKVTTQFGLHIVEVYKATPTKTAVKIATLTKNIVPSVKTQEKTYADASIFAGNNNTKEKFLATSETNQINDAFGITKGDNNVSGVIGNARAVIQWAFNAKPGEVSTPFSIGDGYYVALLVDKNEKGLPNISDNNRLAIQLAAAKAKKGEMLSTKLKGSDLNTLASSNGVAVASAQGLSFANVNIENMPEPKVVGTALGIKEGIVSAPIVGEEGVYVIKVKSKVAAPEDAAAIQAAKENMRNQLRTSITSRLEESIRKAANVVDNRLDFF